MSKSGFPGGSSTARETALAVRGLHVCYQHSIEALRGVDLEVAEGTVTTVLGANGGGKTTLLRALTGLLDFHGGRVTAGEIELRGRSTLRLRPAAIVRRGVAQAMEGRRIFAELTVEENLQIGAVTCRDKAAIRSTRRQILDLFPVLAERLDQQAGYLSGGEQQMLAIGRALMSQPTVLILDEPSLGLAPLIVERIRDVILEVNRAGTTILLVEQNASLALAVADTVAVFENGRVVQTGTAAQLRADPQLARFYLGAGMARQHSADIVSSVT